MKTTMFAALGAITLASCQPQATPPNQPSTPARFEIRDFKLNEQALDYGTTVNGRGTLVAMDDAQKKGNFLVWLTAKRTHKADDSVDMVLILRDGLTTIETSDFLSKDEKDKVKVRYTDWKITGYIRFQEGVLVSEGAASAPQK